MIRVEKLSFSYPQKDLYTNVSFEIEDDVHCALIGSNGTGKSTLLKLILQPEEHLYDGKIMFDKVDRIGYVSQFSQLDPKEDMTVFAFISEPYLEHEKKIADCYTRMETAEDMDAILEVYQTLLDEWNAIDGDAYEVNIKKNLSLSNLEKLEEQKINSLSAGEFKLIQVIKEMMLSPRFLIMDEPDAFLDFKHLNGLRNLINAHKGTLLVITHNRYLLNHCFNKILHMEDMGVNEFDGTYTEYNFELLATKIELEEAATTDQTEIERQRKILDKTRKRATMFDNATLGRSVHARQTMVDRLETRKTKAPFVDIKQPEICFALEDVAEDETILELIEYSVAFDEQLLEHVNFQLKPTDHVAIVGSNGTGKTTMLYEILENKKGEIQVSEEAKIEIFSQNIDSFYDGAKSMYEIFDELGLGTKGEIATYLKNYGFEEDTLTQKLSQLSGGEKDLFQLAVLSLKKSNLLLLDEPTGHLDVYAQEALERAITEYKGAILAVSHDFYTVVNCMDYVLLVENNTIRRMSIRKFRQMIYEHYFDKDYLLLEQKKKETEMRIQQLLKNNEYEQAKDLMEPLKEIIQKM